jgi:hypothetical protein
LHREQTDPQDISAGSIAAAMRAAIKEKTSKMTVKFGKLAAVANPAIGDEFLKEVLIHFISLNYTICILNHISN